MKVTNKLIRKITISIICILALSSIIYSQVKQTVQKQNPKQTEKIMPNNQGEIDSLKHEIELLKMINKNHKIFDSNIILGICQLLTTIGLIYFAKKQTVLNRNMLKIDAHDRRLAVYDKVYSLLRCGFILSKENEGNLERETNLLISKAEFLFPKQEKMVGYFTEIQYRLFSLQHDLNEEERLRMIGMRDEADQLQTKIECEYRQWFENELVGLKKKFEPYLRIEE